VRILPADAAGGAAEESVKNSENGRQIDVDITDKTERRINVTIELTGEQAAAVEGWSAANRISSHKEAVRELVRIGLLSEIGRIYRMISDGRDRDDLVADNQDLTN
jgi:hypothetical protein